MRQLEIRRHSLRKYGGGSQLSQPGVDLARAVGAAMGRFDTVSASVVPRARETAIAMGFAVDFEIVSLCSDDAAYREVSAHRWWEQPLPFVALNSLLRDGSAYHRYANSIAALWRDLLTPLPEGGRALLIGHSGELEAALVACFPCADHKTWGAPFGPCEGARLAFVGNPAYFSDVEFLRLRPIKDCLDLTLELTAEDTTNADA